MGINEEISTFAIVISQGDEQQFFQIFCWVLFKFASKLDTNLNSLELYEIYCNSLNFEFYQFLLYSPVMTASIKIVIFVEFSAFPISFSVILNFDSGISPGSLTLDALQFVTRRVD